MASTEFKINTEKFTPRKATVNGIAGHIWVKRTLYDGAWMYDGKLHLSDTATRQEIKKVFDELNQE